MADSLTVTVTLSGDNWDVTATVAPGGVLPPDIFIYQNLGTTQLGPYVGVCSFTELQRLQVWNSQVIPVFGNRFVRSAQAKILIPVTTDYNPTVQNMIATAKTLKAAMIAAASTTTVYTI